MHYIGIDIGSTSAKTIVLNENKEVIHKDLRATGWSSIDTATSIRTCLWENGFLKEAEITATGYGRKSVSFATKVVTEITCHALGAVNIYDDKNLFVIDIGGQDTKLIDIEDGFVKDFIMNDKCSAGTGRFLEVMANSLGLRPEELVSLGKKGANTSISSMCTVFAESEVVSLIGRGEKKENIAFAVVDSIVQKIKSQSSRFNLKEKTVCLTGGLTEMDYLRESLEKALQVTVKTDPLGRFAGAYGAALLGAKK